jgi:hypothetical protein
MQRLMLLIILTALIFHSCNSENSFKQYEPQMNMDMTETTSTDEYSESEESFEDSTEEKSDYNGNSRSKPNKQIERKIIRNAQINMQVKDIQVAFPQIERIVQSLNGYISSSNMQNNNYKISNSITIRVPHENLDSLLQLVENQSIFINNSSINSTDVTEEFIDIESRLKTKKEVRERYLDILSKKAKTVKDVLLAEEQIRVLTEEIEAKEGRLRYLKNRVGLSTLALSIYQEVEYVATPDVYKKTFLIKIKEGFINGWGILLGILLGLINIWPLVILFTLFIWKRKAIWGKIRRK